MVEIVTDGEIETVVRKAAFWGARCWYTGSHGTWHCRFVHEQVTRAVLLDSAPSG